MKKTLLAALIVATALPTLAPTMAAAQTRELREDRRDVRDAQRDLRDAQRHGDHRDVRDARQDLREARQEHREDWRDYRAQNRNTYARGNWRAPFAYQRFRSGAQIRPAYYNSRYYIANPARYRLPPATGANRWVRHYDDALLVNVRSGRVVRVINGFYW
ncbi:RcnB family protein [Sphingobium sufflavum]|uniref:RcnB family protein n=1 Tax=Sphingobium sufflavum TaxID=1129547 RepID=UPI001F16E074|nr:RcnB family protein [Sphingobium sufflavum]MCE7798807.1 RcnB family protein [Sphingobium sufflavum]